MFNGWLSPAGEFIPVDYQNDIRHGELAEEIVDKYYAHNYMRCEFFNKQVFLVNLGWVRIDEETMCGKEPTNAQIDYMNSQLEFDEELFIEQVKPRFTLDTDNKIWMICVVILDEYELKRKKKESPK